MKIKFPDKFKFWVNHEIIRTQNPLFVNIPENERLTIWKRIEDDYILKYSQFIRIQFDWGLSPIWIPSYPGGFASGPNWSVETFYPLPESLINRILTWVNYRNQNSLFNDSFDYNASNEEGRAITFELRKYIPQDTYLEYDSSFKEVILQGSNSVELEVPDFLRNYLSPSKKEVVCS